MRTKPIGSVIGAFAGLAFVLVNAGAIPGSSLWRTVAAVMFVAILWFVILRGPEFHQPPPDRAALRTYWISVGAMSVAIPVGAAIINNLLDKPNAVLVWVVFVVGVHFLPFARAFKLPVFRWLAVCLVVVAAIGAVLTLAFNSVSAPAATGVAAGFTLLIFSAVGPRLSNRATTPLT